LSKSNPPIHVALATYSEHPDLTHDDRFLLPHLQAHGIATHAVAWDDPAVDWSRYRLCVVRSTWNYHRTLGHFLSWAERVSEVTSLWNPLDVLLWNTHKSYLRDLEQRGVPVVPTEWLQAGSRAPLEVLMQRNAWERVVVKPAVSASAHDTILVTHANLGEGQAHLDNHLPTRDMMVQPFMAAVQTEQERSFIFIDGTFTHSVRRPFYLALDEDHDWPYERADPPPGEITFAQNVLSAAGRETLYARVDVVRDDSGQLRLMELELVEPSLFFQQAPEAAESFATAIARKVHMSRA
jgi:hypothetical protein